MRDAQQGRGERFEPIDTADLLRKVRLEDLAAGDVELRRVATKGGDELHGDCPLCSCTSGERKHRCDRFRVKPDEQRWYCRHCEPKGGDAIAYVQRRDNLNFLEACKALGADTAQATKTAGKLGANAAQATKTAGKREITPGSEPDEPPPSSAWQARVVEYIAQAEAALWSPDGARALGYLHSERGLCDETIRPWRLGYQHCDAYEPASAWGLDGKDVWLPRGIVIPWTQDGQPWALKVRRPVPKTDRHKYHLVRGSACHILFGSQTVVSHRPAILLESELDVLLLAQDASEIVASVSAGAKRTDFTRRQLIVLRKSHPIYVAYDNDQPGREAMQTVVALGPRFRPVTWPEGVKDLAKAWEAGYDVRAWACAQLGLAAICRSCKKYELMPHERDRGTCSACKSKADGTWWL